MSPFEAGDQAGWWNMTFLQAECQRDLESLWDCLELARQLAEHPLSAAKPELAARTYIMLSTAHQGLGHLAEAAANAARAAELVSGMRNRSTCRFRRNGDSSRPSPRAAEWTRRGGSLWCWRRC
ncbi:hypothetical protein ACW0JT_03645 [Arthrobacter sp. SA17]